MQSVNSCKFLFIVLLALNWVSFSNNAPNAEAKGLYSDKDDVEILTVENLKLELYGNQRAWLLEFYHRWCGSCLRFAPSWKAFATDVKGWRNVVGIGAIDCASEDNYPICKDFEVISYPTIRYFHENYEERPNHFGQRISAGFDLVEHRQKLLETIVNEQLEGRGRMYPNLLPYTHVDTTKLLESVPEKAKYAFLIAQEPNNFLAQEVSMDVLELHKIKDFVVRYTLSNNTLLIKNLNLNKYPSLYVIERDHTFQSLNNVPDTREYYKSIIYNYLLPNASFNYV